MSSKILDTRTRILEQTWRLLEKKRGQGVSIKSIADAAGVSRQAVYLHFSSRAELLVATVRYADQKNDIDTRLRGVLTARTGQECLDEYVRFWGNYIPEIHGLAKALLATRDTDTDAAKAWEDRMEVLHEGCRRVMEGLVQGGMLASEWTPEQAAEMMWAMFSVSVWESLTIELGWTNDEYVSRMQLALKRIFLRQD
jgi:AcrR family transcriptional regulator